MWQHIYWYALPVRNRCLHVCVSFLEQAKAPFLTLPWLRDKKLALFYCVAIDSRRQQVITINRCYLIV